jgi:hypothetical protein
MSNLLVVDVNYLKSHPLYELSLALLKAGIFLVDHE